MTGMLQAYHRVLARNFKCLLDDVEPKLLGDSLVTNGVFSSAEIADLTMDKGSLAATRAILFWLNRMSEEKFNQFVKSLKESGHDDCACQLKEDMVLEENETNRGAGACAEDEGMPADWPPRRIEYVRSLLANPAEYILGRVIPERLDKHLISCGVLSIQSAFEASEETHVNERVRVIFRSVNKQPAKKLPDFIQCLRDSDHEDLYNIFRVKDVEYLCKESKRFEDGHNGEGLTLHLKTVPVRGSNGSAFTTRVIAPGNSESSKSIHEAVKNNLNWAIQNMNECIEHNDSKPIKSRGGAVIRFIFDCLLHGNVLLGAEEGSILLRFRCKDIAALDWLWTQVTQGHFSEQLNRVFKEMLRGDECTYRIAVKICPRDYLRYRDHLQQQGQKGIHSEIGMSLEMGNDMTDSLIFLMSNFAGDADFLKSLVSREVLSVAENEEIQEEASDGNKVRKLSELLVYKRSTHHQGFNAALAETEKHIKSMLDLPEASVLTVTVEETPTSSTGEEIVAMKRPRQFEKKTPDDDNPFFDAISWVDYWKHNNEPMLNLEKKTKKCIERLTTCSEHLEKIAGRTDSATDYATTIGALGLVVAGIGLIPFTAGGSLTLSAAGGALLVLGYATVVIADLIKYGWEKADSAEGKRALKDLISLLSQLNDLISRTLDAFTKAHAALMVKTGRDKLKAALRHSKEMSNDDIELIANNLSAFIWKVCNSEAARKARDEHFKQSFEKIKQDIWDPLTEPEGKKINVLQLSSEMKATATVLEDVSKMLMNEYRDIGCQEICI